MGSILGNSRVREAGTEIDRDSMNKQLGKQLNDLIRLVRDGSMGGQGEVRLVPENLFDHPGAGIPGSQLHEDPALALVDVSDQPGKVNGLESLLGDRGRARGFTEDERFATRP